MKNEYGMCNEDCTNRTTYGYCRLTACNKSKSKTEKREITYEQAHGYIEDLQRIFTQYRPIFSNGTVQANGKAIEALEKQIPKKPIKQVKTIYLSKATDVLCPVCNKSVCTWITFDSHSKAVPYCRHCGQRIDWSEIYGKENANNGEM